MGGNVASIQRCQNFNNWIEICDLRDLGFHGPKFTLNNNQEGLANIQERIDRSLANESWCKLFPNNAILHIRKTHSNHFPVLTCCYGLEEDNKARSFRFEKAWLVNEECKPLIENIWEQNPNVVDAIEKVPEVIIPWNKEKFGNIFYKKRKLLGRINGIQKSLARHYSSFLANLEKRLVREYNVVLKQKELFWFQKSRVKWIKDGDSNTKFSTILRFLDATRIKLSC